MDCATQIVLGTLSDCRERVHQGERIEVNHIPAILSAIQGCPARDQKLLCDHLAMTLAASDNMLEHVVVYKASLYLWALNGTNECTPYIS
jgi:hypothetical protein